MTLRNAARLGVSVPTGRLGPVEAEVKDERVPSRLGVGRLAAMTASFLVTFGIRGLALKLGWSLPVFPQSAKQQSGENDETLRKSGDI